jgi:site-specific recombinase XerD
MTDFVPVRKKKVEKIKNKLYKEFLEHGIIKILTEEHIKQALANVKGKNIREGRSLIIALYYTGARPNEILRMKAGDIEKEDKYIKLRVKASKGGLPRTIYLPFTSELPKQLLEYASSLPSDMYLFYHYLKKYKRKHINKFGVTKEYLEISNNLRYYFKKWFDKVIEESIPPYYLRHNRFSKLIEAGITLEEARMLKGSKTFNSIVPYIHMSTHAARNIAKKME